MGNFSSLECFKMSAAPAKLSFLIVAVTSPHSQVMGRHTEALAFQVIPCPHGCHPPSCLSVYSLGWPWYPLLLSSILILRHLLNPIPCL